MSALQWALLLLGLGIVVALIWSSRREKRASERAAAPARPATLRDWSEGEMVPGGAVARPEPAASFDEFGVSKARRRVAPEVSAAQAPPAVAPVPASAPVKVIGFYIAEHEGTNILGPKIHGALQDRGLRYGAKRIYHRMEGDQPVFSVASLVKPGALDPAEAEGFATPGLSIFMPLPGPARPLAVFQDMLDTARALARALNAELYDAEERAPLTIERERALHAMVEEWARRQAGSGRGA